MSSHLFRQRNQLYHKDLTCGKHKARAPVGASAVYKNGIPSLWEHFRHAPAQCITQRLYEAYAKLRPTATFNGRTQLTPVIRVVCISDTHGAHLSLPPLPPGDILVHTGDLSTSGTEKQIRAALKWLAAAPHQHKVFIAGNHDLALAHPPTRDAILADYPTLTYLENSSATLEFYGRSVNIYGTPCTLKRGETGAFQYKDDKRWLWWLYNIPSETHILLTHGPPLHHRDVAGLGCRHVLAALWRIRPVLHVFGHIHAGRGVEHARFASLQIRYERSVRGKDNWMATLGLMWALLWERLFGLSQKEPMFRLRTHSLLVNASSVARKWSSQLLEPIVVELPLIPRTSNAIASGTPTAPTEVDEKVEAEV
ncbi:Metallo-dependent phosphatase-like protein [Lenzites betulinus]|nr:Metallo-dependent phosphatase-like protein [Lenzites betulinus]